jgi:hypothetical protein
MDIVTLGSSGFDAISFWSWRQQQVSGFAVFSGDRSALVSHAAA